jgi:acetyl esterase/lipase
MATALAEEGYAVCVPEFRRTGQPGGGWPGTFDDIAVATDALPSIIASAAPGVVDVGRIALVGHSAGGHLASWAAARHRLPETSPWRRTSPLPVRGVLSLAGISDVGACARLELDDRAAQLLLGGDPEEVPERFAIADPMSLLPSGLRTVLLHGENDQQVPPELNVRYAEAARLAGDDTELRLLSGVEHFALIDPLSPVWSVVLSTLEGLFPPNGLCRSVDARKR